MQKKCPKCRCEKFYIQDLDDSYTTYTVECVDDRLVFDKETDPENAPAVNADTPISCERCSWKGSLEDLEK
jgi:hypothetical protein